MSSHRLEVAPARATALRERYREVRAATAFLAAPLSPEDQLVQSMPDASPTKWHLAHATWFFETFVRSQAQPGYRAVDARYAYLFNSYYEAVGPRPPRPRRGAPTHPSLDEVRAYRDAIDERMDALLARAPEDGDLLDRIELGLQHEQQPAASHVPGAVPPRAARGHGGRLSPLRRGRRLPPARPLALGRLGGRAGTRLGRAAVLGARLRRLVRVHPGRHAADPARRSRRPRQLLRGRGFRALGRVPYPRFRPLEGALGEYNGKFMSGQMVLRGGSCFTPRSHVRVSYRSFFPPGARWQMSGIRLARGD